MTALRKRLEQLASIEKKVKDALKREDLAEEWWSTPLETLGNKSPHDSWIAGNFDKVEKVAKVIFY
jgi:hypothetical protein